MKEKAIKIDISLKGNIRTFEIALPQNKIKRKKSNRAEENFKDSENASSNMQEEKDKDESIDV